MEQAFQWAHAADPDALLFYNEAEVETYDAKANAVAAMVQDFRRRGRAYRRRGIAVASVGPES